MNHTAITYLTIIVSNTASPSTFFTAMVTVVTFQLGCVAIIVYQITTFRPSPRLFTLLSLIKHFRYIIQYIFYVQVYFYYEKLLSTTIKSIKEMAESLEIVGLCLEVNPLPKSSVPSMLAELPR